MIPKIGQWLYASCSAVDYGEIVAVGIDDNGVSTIDIRVEDPQELIHFDEEFGGPGFGRNALTTLEIPAGVSLILRGLQYREVGEDLIECHTPGSGCYRCTKLFTLRDQRTSWD